MLSGVLYSEHASSMGRLAFMLGVAGLILFVVPLMIPPAQAAERVDAFHFDNETQRDRYQALIAELRCPKCLNTNIAGSDAPIAQDLRKLVHQFVVEEGRSDQEILDFLHARYGDFVLYDPPFNARTWLLWLLPVMVGLVVIGLLYRLRTRASQEQAAPLSEAEQARLRDLQELP